MFYQVTEGLEPVLYGFTSDKLRAAIFKLYRPNLREIQKDISKDDYNEMLDKLQKKEIIPHQFKTSSDHFDTMKVSQVATHGEVMSIILHKEELLLQELSKHAVPLAIFTKGNKKVLKKVYMDTVLSYAEEIERLPFDPKNAIPKSTFDVDELGLFVQLYGHTMNKK